MMCDFNKVFNLTPEQKQAQEELDHKLIQRSYDEKWCCTCENYIPVDEKLSGMVVAFPECKVKELATGTCVLYKRKGDK